jgi:hypothetical protein
VAARDVGAVDLAAIAPGIRASAPRRAPRDPHRGPPPQFPTFRRANLMTTEDFVLPLVSLTAVSILFFGLGYLIGSWRGREQTIRKFGAQLRRVGSRFSEEDL